MKRFLLCGFLMLALTAFSSSAWALRITENNTDVGDFDTLIAVSNLANQGEDYQAGWIEDVLAIDNIFVTKEIEFDENIADTSRDQIVNIYDSSDDSKIGIGYELSDISFDYFLIKTGNDTNEYRDWLFANNGSDAWAVISSIFEDDEERNFISGSGYSGVQIWNDLAYQGVSGADIVFDPTNIYKISHISVSTPVPEPATMMLFGLGLLGLAGVSRKKLVK